ncbi:MAG: transposase [Candidatus Moranbacteria bacterium]|nr:transposase [Candidatus Moranbacteria bacterium]
MPKTIQEERLRWVLPIVGKEVRLCDIAKVCPHGKRTLERWVAAYRRGGKEALIPRSTRPKTSPYETPIHIKEQVISLRKKTGLCARKLSWKLGKEGVAIHGRVVGKILKQEGLVRTYRVRKVKTKYVKMPLQPGELMEIDVKYVPERIGEKAYFQYTAIDCSSRWRYLLAYEEMNIGNSIRFLESVISVFPHRIRSVKTDNGSIFTNSYLGTNKRSDMTVKTIHAFDIFCRDNGIIHYLIDPGKPAQNGKVERSHREDQEKFYECNVFVSFEDLQTKLKTWNMYYNDLEHCGLNGKSPNEFLKEFELINPPNVCT